ncbi:MAG: GHMP kinase, partial [Promethearchaeota archaeon]
MIRIRSPGRICLFGEHQDYLGYPIISLAISKYIFLEAQKVNKPIFSIHFPDIETEIEIKLRNKELTYESNRDYIKSGYNLFVRKGIKFPRGYDIKIWGNLPINAGVASSSALIIAWIYFLSLSSNREISSPYNLALQGYNAEVKEFNEAGGMMDHFSSVFGKLIFLQEQAQKPVLNFYDLLLNGFVLGNSMERKSTVDDLRKVKKNSLDSFRILKDIYPNFNKYHTSLVQITPYLDSIEKKFRKKIIGNLSNRDITNSARNLIDNYYKIKDLATESQKNLF